MAKDSSLGAWRGGLSVSALVLATLAVTLAYLTRPQGPSELLDRTVLILDADAYQPNVRVAGRMVKQALRAEALERYARAQGLRREAARRFALAGESTPDGRRAVAANDKAARLYLALGWANYREGKGTVIIGLGREE